MGGLSPNLKLQKAACAMIQRRRCLMEARLLRRPQMNSNDGIRPLHRTAADHRLRPLEQLFRRLEEKPQFASGFPPHRCQRGTAGQHHGGVRVVPAGVEWDPLQTALRAGDGIHIRPENHRPAGAAPLKRAHYPRCAAGTLPYLEARRRQLCGNVRAGLVLLKSNLRHFMERLIVFLYMTFHCSVLSAREKPGPFSSPYFTKER